MKLLASVAISINKDTPGISDICKALGLTVDSQIKASTGLVLTGRRDSNYAVATIVVGTTAYTLPFCANSDHTMCSTGQACWGFICVNKGDPGAFCTHDVHCKNNVCGDELGALWCLAECSQDTDCPTGKFCEQNQLNANFGKCRAAVRCQQDLATICVFVFCA